MEDIFLTVLERELLPPASLCAGGAVSPLSHPLDSHLQRVPGLSGTINCILWDSTADLCFCYSS